MQLVCTKLNTKVLGVKHKNMNSYYSVWFLRRGVENQNGRKTMQNDHAGYPQYPIQKRTSKGLCPLPLQPLAVTNLEY